MSATISAPDEQQKLAEVSSEVSAVVARAREVEVSTPEQAQDATAFLAEVKAAKSRSERARKFIVDPLNAHVRRINATMKEQVAPLDEADQLVRGKVLAFRREQEREREREQARLDEERRIVEEQAAAARRAAEEEALRVEREAAEAEAQRQAKIAAQRGKRRKEIAAMSDVELVALEDAGSDRDMGMAEEELAARDRARRDAERAAEARQRSEEALQASIAAQAAPAPTAAAPTRLAAAAGTAAVHRVWKATIVDESQLPRDCLSPDMKLINAKVRAGIREIPGVRIEQVSGLAVRANG